MDHLSYQPKSARPALADLNRGGPIEHFHPPLGVLLPAGLSWVTGIGEPPRRFNTDQASVRPWATLNHLAPGS